MTRGNQAESESTISLHPFATVTVRLPSRKREAEMRVENHIVIFVHNRNVSVHFPCAASRNRARCSSPPPSIHPPMIPAACCSSNGWTRLLLLQIAIVVRNGKKANFRNAPPDVPLRGHDAGTQALTWLSNLGLGEIINARLGDVGHPRVASTKNASIKQKEFIFFTPSTRAHYSMVTYTCNILCRYRKQSLVPARLQDPVHKG